MNETNRLQIEVEAHVPWAKGVVRRFAEKIGFREELLAEIEICISELASNLVVHKATNGSVSFREIAQNGRKGIEILVEDEGPGIKDLKGALQGGASTVGSLGQGLASVQRFADEFEIQSNLQGTRIAIRKYLPSESLKDGIAVTDLTVSVAVRTHPESNVCGDGHVIRHDSQRTTLAVIDGLGHGSHARDAAAIAEAYIHANYRKPLEQMPDELHSALHVSRGAVVGIARIDEAERTISFMGVGNISARLWLPDKREWTRFVSMSGTLGVSLRAPRVLSNPWTQESVFIMHSDGLREHWELEKNTLKKPAAEISRMLMQDFWRRTDDATVMVAK